MTFSNLGLSSSTLAAIDDAGYAEPTPIQAKAIPEILAGRDVLGCAQTGTGKTASFTLPMIDLLSQGRARARMPRSLILTPTRELATQVAENFETYGKYNKLTMALLIGGVSLEEQTRKLGRGVDVLIATPGRLLDHIGRGGILLTDIRVLVIDEADRMLDMGFIPDVERISSLLPATRQTLFFSATLPPEIRRLSDKFVSNPIEITVAPVSRPAAETVTQSLAIIPGTAKREALRRIIRSEGIDTALLFCNRKRDVDILFRSLRKHGFNAAALHGDMDQQTRLATLERFKNGEVGLLVASDVAARGLDIDDLPTVVNFDVPTHPEDYVHRIGRTGRAGREGCAYMLASEDEGRYVAAIEELLGFSIPHIAVDGIGTGAFDAEKPKPRRTSGRGRRRGEKEALGTGLAARSAGHSAGKRKRASQSAESKRPARAEKGRRDRREDDDTPVVGLGDHVPAFLLKSGNR